MSITTRTRLTTLRTVRITLITTNTITTHPMLSMTIQDKEQAIQPSRPQELGTTIQTKADGLDTHHTHDNPWKCPPLNLFNWNNFWKWFS